MEERLSSIELAWEADERRRKGPSVAESSAAAREREARQQSPAVRFEAAARALPDSLFFDDPEIKLLADEVASDRYRLDHLVKTNRRVDLEALISDFHEQIERIQAQQRAAAVDDAIAGEYEFPRYMANADRLSRLQHQLGAAELAYEVYTRSVPTRAFHFLPGADRARQALADALIRKKCEHVRAHPELLDPPEAATHTTAESAHD